MDSLSKEETRIFICKRSDYYLDMWERYAGTAYFKGWNCSTLLFGVIWVVYRKMYKEAAILFGIQLLAAAIGLMPLLLLLFNTTLQWSVAHLIIIATNVITFGVSVYCGIFGNKLYRDKTERTLKNIQDLHVEGEQQQRQLIERKGGTNDTIVVICIIVTVIALLWSIL